MPAKANNATALKNRFEYLKSLFHQAPLPENQLIELVNLAEKFDKKMAKYLKDNYNLVV